MSEIPRPASFFEIKSLGLRRDLLKWKGPLGQPQVEPLIDKKAGTVKRTLDEQSGWDPVLMGNHQLYKSLQTFELHLLVHPTLPPLSFLSVMLQITSTLRPWYQVYWLLCTSRSNTCQIFHGRGKKQYTSRDGHLFIFLNSTFCTSQLLKHNGTILWSVLWGSAAFAIAFQRLLRTLHPIITK